MAEWIRQLADRIQLKGYRDPGERADQLPTATRIDERVPLRSSDILAPAAQGRSRSTILYGLRLGQAGNLHPDGEGDEFGGQMNLPNTY